MEMHSIHMDNIMEVIEDESTRQLSTPCSPDVGDIFGEPQELPRVGVRYQAEIPSLIAECDQVINEPADSEFAVNLPESFSLGLPIPIMWANCELENFNRTVDFENREESQITSNGEDSKLDTESLATSLCDGKSAKKMSGLQPVGSDSMEVDDLPLSVEFKNKLDQVERGFCPLPGCLGESWTDIECDSFLLGLYIFGKNLILVKRFVESKEMGNMLSFYHGKFYGSDRYRRWSECRKLRSRRRIYGRKIFKGWRQQELLSRLSSHVSEECQYKLLEVSRTFGEGKFSFEEYIFALKDTVGINMLIEAVGIGKGKQDLTGLAMEPIKTNHVISLHPEIPIGKACSSLTASDIIKFLRGNVRLSKARSSDLFWEAVWPRLLARGWHSEQPNDHGVSGSKHSLVFLIPGVKKFSRRKLVKGNHYFDSVTDVLNKVASDPGLLELQIDADEGSGHKEDKWEPLRKQNVDGLSNKQHHCYPGEGSGHKEDKWEPLRKQNVDGLSNKQHHCYLQPRTSNCNRDLVKFTVVDTSVVHETELPKVRELRSLPVHTTSLSTPSSLSNETEQDTSEESEDEAEEINTSNPAGDMTEMEASVDSSDCAVVLNAMDPIIASVEDHNSPNTSLLKENGQGKAMKHHFSKKMNSSNSEYLAPVMKQQALNAFNCGESSHSIGDISADRKQNEDQSHCQSTLPSACHDMAFRVCPQNLSSDSSLAKSSQEESNAASVTENCLGGEVSPGNHQPRIFIDLNLPHNSPDIGTEEPFIMDMMPTNGSSCANKLSSLSKTSHWPEPSKISDSGASTERQPTMNSRRQSMRSRPLTTKVWEALECGLFDTKRKRKRVDTSHNSISRSSRKIRGNAALSSTLNNGAGNDIVDSTMDVNLDEVCSSKVNVAGESPV